MGCNFKNKRTTRQIVPPTIPRTRHKTATKGLNILLQCMEIYIKSLMHVNPLLGTTPVIRGKDYTTDLNEGSNLSNMDVSKYTKKATFTQISVIRGTVRTNIIL